MAPPASDKRETLTQKILLVLILMAAAGLIILTVTHKKIERDYHWNRDTAVPSSQHAPPAENKNPDRASIYSLLGTVTDPELDVDIVNLGLINDVAVQGDHVKIVMLLTTPNCPYVPEMIESVRKALFSHPGVGRVDLHIAKDPPWDINRVSAEARAKLLEKFQAGEVPHE